MPRSLQLPAMATRRNSVHRRVRRAGAEGCTPSTLWPTMRRHFVRFRRQAGRFAILAVPSPSPLRFPPYRECAASAARVPISRCFARTGGGPDRTVVESFSRPILYDLCHHSPGSLAPYPGNQRTGRPRVLPARPDRAHRPAVLRSGNHPRGQPVGAASDAARDASSDAARDAPCGASSEWRSKQVALDLERLTNGNPRGTSGHHDRAAGGGR